MSQNQPGLVPNECDGGHVSAALSCDQSGQVPLAVTKLTLTDFRCYDHLRLETSGRPVVLTGANGAGKTNILEALSFLVPGRGLRGSRMNEIARRETGDVFATRQWAVAATAQGTEGPVELGTGLEAALNGRRDKRIVRIDGETAKAQAMLAEHLSCQWLTPQMDRLFLEGATTRRRFLDRLVFGYDAAHAGRVNAYNQAMRERLKLLTDGNRDDSWLTGLEDSMATRGIAVAAARQDMAEALNRICQDHQGPFPGAEISIVGTLEKWLADGPALEAEDRFKEALRSSRNRDGENGTTATGPHRSDLRVIHAGKGQVAELCSTGEQKALLIAIVFANARLQAEMRGSVPILLLDEVAAHLDESKRAALFNEILALGAQAWLTGTDIGPFQPLKDKADFFNVADAAVQPQAH